MQAKNRVYRTLKETVSEQGQITAVELAEKMNLSRQVVSHYLTRLMEDGLVLKTSTRPVYWYLVAEEDLDFLGVDMKALVKEEVVREATTKETVIKHVVIPTIHPEGQDDKPSVFSTLVGYDGSQRKTVELCEAAVNYPPSGLPMLITGESGVGKSFIVRLIYEYAVEKKVIERDAPFVVLNCSDYANNPELLSATLLGYKKGSFTGADRDKDGLLLEANGGYLFLDEVHRLNFENQEKLFLFMDSGKYRPIGAQGWKKSKVRLIFATTEKPEDVLLDTFRRRITLQVPISNMMERPLRERIQLVSLFYQKEAQIIQKEIKVQGSVVGQLCFSKTEGNIGKIKNLIQLSCANAFYQQMGKDTIVISPAELTSLPWENMVPDLGPLHIGQSDSIGQNANAKDRRDSHEMLDLWNEIVTLSEAITENDIRSIFLNFKKRYHKLRKDMGVVEEGTVNYLISETCKNILLRYGIVDLSLVTENLCFLYENFIHSEIKESDLNKLDSFFDETMPKAFYVANCLCRDLEVVDGKINKNVLYLFTLTLHEYIIEELEFHGLIVAHGNATASSIQNVVNQTCKTFVFEAVDMPMDTTIDDTIAKVQQYLEKVNTRKGMILLIDTGSLGQLYSSINNFLSGDLLIINNVSTAIALDIGIKMLGNLSFLDIVSSARESYMFEIQYFEGISRGRNIIVSCMSGVGIAEKLQETMKKVIDSSVVDIVTLDYKELLTLLENNEKDYFGQTLLILTTSSLPEHVKVPWLNIYDILEGKGEQRLWNSLRGLISKETFDALKLEYIRFFSIEGIVSRLRFLNPAVIVDEVELILMKYEQYYDFEMTGHVRLNLYMHIAFMIERLMTSTPEENEVEMNVSKEEHDFYNNSAQVFKDVELKYRIKVDNYEKALLYELFRRIIKYK